MLLLFSVPAVAFLLSLNFYILATISVTFGLQNFFRYYIPTFKHKALLSKYCRINFILALFSWLSKRKILLVNITYILCLPMKFSYSYFYKCQVQPSLKSLNKSWLAIGMGLNFSQPSLLSLRMYCNLPSSRALCTNRETVGTFCCYLPVLFIWYNI